MWFGMLVVMDAWNAVSGWVEDKWGMGEGSPRRQSGWSHAYHPRYEAGINAWNYHHVD